MAHDVGDPAPGAAATTSGIRFSSPSVSGVRHSNRAGCPISTRYAHRSAAFASPWIARPKCAAADHRPSATFPITSGTSATNVITAPIPRSTSDTSPKTNRVT